MSAGGGPRLLLRRLREIMAEHQSAQARLDKLVSVIAANMVAEVCSIYLQRAGGILDGARIMILQTFDFAPERFVRVADGMHLSAHL